MENKEKTLTTIEKSQELTEKTSKVDPVAIEAAKKEFEDFANQLQKKLYLISGGKTTAQAILKFLENDAEWIAHESLGIEKAFEDVQKAMKKGKELMLPALCVKAISYFVGKFKGVGLASAKKYKEELFTPLNEAMGRIQNDEKKLEELQQKWTAAVQGVKLEGQD